ncbi:probable disease resistance protein At5g66900 isoform X2 [Durio zibethinus]|uniref:Probable disease resistance protein At5g66900 isoform X2 n=1 Tax=Durio zibethinus TaxID=66656 RepID=A0A6P6BDQ2_DURZI|nr:probable disease resistance protein At5g66900 isoform X2 [Durio zibethinus]
MKLKGCGQRFQTLRKFRKDSQTLRNRGALFRGAALEAGFGELVGAVVEAIKTAAMFRDVLEELNSTLLDIQPIIKDIESLNKGLDKEHETKQLIEIILKGNKLVSKCSNIQRWNFFKKTCYTYKLQRFKESLQLFCQIDLQIQQTRDIKDVLFGVKGLSMEVRRFSSKEGSGSENGMFSQVAVVGSCKVPEPPGKVVGFDVPLAELKVKLFKDGVSVIVVSAPGGSGKTTLVKELCRDEKVKGKFKENIFYVNVSKAPNVEIILRKLLQVNDHRMPEFQSEEDALNQLEQNLRQMATDPILLILDDVWSGSESLVDKLKFSLPDYKILVTSRFAFARFDSTYILKPLHDDDAMTLFHHSAFSQNGNPYIPEDLVNKVMKSCKGLPLALEVVGRSLYGQPVAVWQSREKQLSKGLPIFHSSSELLACLESSLDALDSMVGLKDCYLDLGSFPEDHMIPATALSDMWVEQHKLDEDNDAFVILHEFSIRNLVNLVVMRKDASEADGYYNDHFIMQHDLLRELVIYLSSLDPVEKRKRLIVELSSNNFPNWWLEEKQPPLGARLLSISTDETFSFNWGSIQAPEVEVLVLNFRTKNYTLPVFMEKMEKLKVLIVMNNGIYPTELSNFPLLCSLSNLTRMRLEKVSVPSLSMSSLHLKNLRKISLVMCNIGQAFKNGTYRMSDTFPNLLEIDIDYCDDLVELTGGFCDLVQLMKLSITNCHKLRALPEGIGKLVNLKVLRLTSCTDLMTLPETIGSLSQLTVLDISDCLSIINMPIQIGELHNLSKLYMRGCSSCNLPSTIKKLQHLKDVICDEETSYQWLRNLPRVNAALFVGEKKRARFGFEFRCKREGKSVRLKNPTRKAASVNLCRPHTLNIRSKRVTGKQL